MKVQLIIIALMLVLSLFAGAGVIAREGADDLQRDDNRARIASDAEPAVAGAGSSTDVALTAVSSGELSSEDIADEVEMEAEEEIEIEQRNGVFKALPAKAFYGQGWAITGSEGNLANIFFVNKVFVKKDDLNGIRTEVVRGTLRIGNEKFKFMSERDVNSAADSVTSKQEYTVYTSRGTGKTAVGKLTLELVNDLAKMDVWKGTLKLDSGTSYEVNLAIKERAVRKSDDVKTAKDAREKAEEEIEQKIEQRKEVETKAAPIVATRCSQYSTDSEDYAECKAQVYQQYTASLSAVRESVKSGKTNSRWEDFFTKFFRGGKGDVDVNTQDRSGSNSGSG